MTDQPVLNEKAQKALIESLEATYETAKSLVQMMPKKGDISDYCQRTAMINALNEFEHLLSGTTSDDFVPDEEYEPEIGPIEDVESAVEALGKAVSSIKQHAN